MTDKTDLNALGLALHHRLLTGDDVVVTAEIAETFLPLLVEQLCRRFHKLHDQHAIEEQAGQALLNYFHRPSTFDPSRGTLLGFLKMDASHNILDIIRAEKRKKGVELPLGSAEYLVSGQDAGPDFELLQRELPPALERLIASLSDDRDRRLLVLMTDGERSTEQFAIALGIQNLSQSEKEQTVKRHKDRLKKKLQRYMERHDHQWLESAGLKHQDNRKRDDD